MPEQWMIDGVREALVRAGDRGETLTRAQLQQDVGVGAGDLDVTLEALRVADEVSEVAPGEFEAIARGDEVPERPRPDDADSTAAGRAFAAGMRLPPIVREAEADDEKRVVLTTAVAKAIGPEGLGNLVAAGIEEADEAGVAFVFEVTP